MDLIAAGVSGFVVTAVAILTLRPLAMTLDLVDRPGGRKTHRGVVPLVGGLAMFLGIATSLGFFSHLGGATGPLVGACALLTVIGLIDDRFALSHWMRLGVHLAVAFVLVKGTGGLVRDIGNPFGGNTITLDPVVSTAFTVMLITAAINAFNMLDGLDGLAGISALVALGGLAALIAGDSAAAGELLLAIVMSASVCGFLLFNLPIRANRRFRCFMGDAGSTVLGVVVAWLSVRVSQLTPQIGVRPVTVLWLVAMPLYELFWTVIRRLLRGQSPFRADAQHSHHLLINAGLSVRAAFILLAAIEVACAATGLLLNEWNVSDNISLVLLILVGVLTIRSLYRAHWILGAIPAARRTYHRAKDSAG
jgi:UDP-GlcNAc:undecaprenyl-phosphate/decaprenyl-phosphate GlcNAc-1-phosphate transferase